MRTTPLSTRELVLFWSHCRRVGHDQRAWLLREQIMLLTSISSLSVQQMLNLRVDDVHVSRRGVSWFDLHKRYSLCDPYMRARMMSWQRHCLVYGYEYWLTRPRSGLRMDRRSVSSSIRGGLRLLFGDERVKQFSLEKMRKRCENRGYRAHAERALGIMLEYVDVSGVSCGVWDDEIGLALRDDSVRRRAYELSVTVELEMNVSRIRSKLRKLGLIGMVDTRRELFEGFLRHRCPDRGDGWYMNKFYEWVCQELIGDGYEKRVNRVDVECGSGPGVDGVCTVEGEGVSSDAGV
tara:strand:- start:6741 stop:7619 length:879 start_codon:yes stop_codon:yes gene_type:complete